MSDLICTQTESRLQKSPGISSKITTEHLQLQAALYIRQSTGAQLREHQESTARQYALRDRLTGLGWAQNQIVVIDEDLGLKGIIAELELHTMKVRLERGRMNKASRGELFHDVPVGYMLDSRGLPMLDPDESARHVMKLFFELFQTLRSANGLFHYLSEHNIRLPFRENRRDGSCSIDWRLPSKSTVYGLLKHPLYAGAFGYRRLRKYSQKTQGKQKKKYLPPDQWKVLIKNLHPAYISWEDYEGIQQQLSENDNVGDRRGIPREGSALLAGIVRCSHCGRRLSPSYPSSFQPIYRCGRHRTMAGVSPCYSSIRCTTLDDFVQSRILEAIAPAGVELSLRVIEDEESRRTQLDTLYAHRVEQAQFLVESSERRYRHVDPANRLVAARLEKEWEASLAALESASQQLSQFRNATPVQLSKSERDRLHQACADMTVIWRSEASLVERKQLARLLLTRVDVDVQNNSEQVHVTLHWSGGFESVHKIARAVQKFDQLDGYRCPRQMKAISASTVTRLLLQNPMACKQLNAPDPLPDHWLADDLARRLSMPTKRLKDWVTRGWAIAAQRPHGRVWVIIADEQEVERLQALARRQEGQGRPLPPEELRIPLSNSREK